MKKTGLAMADMLDNTPPELQPQRLAVYNALLSILNEKQARSALDSWPNYLTVGGSAFNGLHAFARDVCVRFHITGQQRDVVRALNRALLEASRGRGINDIPNQKHTPSGQLSVSQSESSQPGSIDLNKIIKSGQSRQQTSTEEIASSAAIETADFQTFQALMNALLQLVENNGPGLRYQAVYFLNEVVSGMPWSHAQQQQMLTLLSTGNAQQTRTYQLDHLKRFLQHFRAWMVDEMGANVASHIVKQALHDTEKTLSGIHYPPTNFL